MPQLDVYAVSLEVIRSVRPVVVAIGRRDKDLEKQARRAASSVALNMAVTVQNEVDERSESTELHSYRPVNGYEVL